MYMYIHTFSSLHYTVPRPQNKPLAVVVKTTYRADCMTQEAVVYCEQREVSGQLAAVQEEEERRRHSIQTTRRRTC